MSESLSPEPMEFVVRSMTEDDWEPYRGIRIEMLRDTPMAYGETLESALALDEAGWRRRADARSTPSRPHVPGTAVTSIRFAAILPDGTWIGSMGGYVDERLGPVLVGVYVAPAYRGDAFGVTSALIEAVEDWARELAPTIHLDVHESNVRARASYAKRGYVETGNTQPYPIDPRFTEIEMVKQLR